MSSATFPGDEQAATARQRLTAGLSVPVPQRASHRCRLNARTQANTSANCIAVRPDTFPAAAVETTSAGDTLSAFSGRVVDALEPCCHQRHARSTVVGIKLTSVASQTYSKSARAMLEALLSGVTKPEELAELAKARMRSKIPQLREALANRFDVSHHGIMVAQLLAHIDTLEAVVGMLDEKIESMLAPHAKIVELLCTIPGVAVRTAQVLIAECGLDMSRFPTVGHFASWAGICPGHHHIVRDEVPFRELCPDWQKKRYSPEHRARRLQRQIEALGFKVTLEQGEAAEQDA